MSSVRVIVVDDHDIMRKGLTLILASNPGIEVIGEAGNGRAAIEMVDQLRPDIVLMDISMPDLNGVDATLQIRARFPETKVLALSALGDRRYVERMLEAGASGYLVKSSAADELLRAIDAVARGRKFVSAEVADAVIGGGHGKLSPATSTPNRLASREREVLQRLAEGKTSKEIAVDLEVSVRTVETHRSNIMQKLDLHNLADLTKYAIREGLIQMD